MSIRNDATQLPPWAQPEQGEEHKLTWNPAPGIGSIESTNYKDGGRYCWDDSGDDIDCPDA